jgi:hypothetical protein
LRVFAILTGTMLLVKKTLALLFRILTLGIPLLGVLDAIAGQDAQEFQVEGVMRTTQTSTPPTSSRVQIEHRGSQWAIREITRLSPVILHPTNLPVPNVWVHSLSNDGTNIYYLEHVESNSIRSASFDHPNAIPNSLNGHIHSLGFPKWVLEPTMVSLFYAYLSARYLDEATNNLLDPISFGPNEMGLFGDQQVRAIHRRAPGPHGLPKEIVFLDYEAKSTNFLLIASSFTNVFGIQLPLRVVVTRYNTRNGEPLQIYEFEVTGIRDKGGPSSFRPDLTPGALVRDYRFSHGTAYVQGIDHGILTNWPTEAEAKLRPDYEGNKFNWELIRLRSLNGI